MLIPCTFVSTLKTFVQTHVMNLCPLLVHDCTLHFVHTLRTFVSARDTPLYCTPPSALILFVKEIDNLGNLLVNS
jgi:hypothetical protein